MKLSISNIAWGPENDIFMYSFLQSNGFSGLEIAPTRIFLENPYHKLAEAQQWSNDLANIYNLVVPSMQSIWYGHSELVFGTKEERNILIDYTKKAVLFAEAIGCKNLVFGNPRNRDTVNVVDNSKIAIDFFKEIGDFAFEHNTFIALEPNPTIYNTRFMNKTEEAVEMAYKTNSKGIKVNADLGAMIYNNEDINYLEQIADYVNHIHISEPGLLLIEERYDLHSQLLKICKDYYSDKFISIEMGKQEIDKVKSTLLYIKKVINEI
jgi:sugar phosphate isomerase/epimerase